MKNKRVGLERDIQRMISNIDESNERITESYNTRIRMIEEQVRHSVLMV